MKRLLLLVIITILSLSSCRGDDDNILNGSKRISQININNEILAKIYYYENGLLSGIDYYKDGDISSKKRMIYENGLLKTYETYDENNKLTGYDEYFYEGKLVVKANLYRTLSNDEVSPIGTEVYINRPGKFNNIIETKRYNIFGEFTGGTKIKYHDDLGSYTSTYYDSENKAYSTFTKTKDDKIAYNKYFNAFSYQNEHNTTTVSYKSFNNPDNNISIENSYIYDKNGYPITCIRKSGKGTVDKFEYIWK